MLSAVAASVAVLLSAAPAMAAPAQTALMPLPHQVTMETGELPLAGPFQVTWGCARTSFLDHAVERFQRDADRLTGANGPQPPGPALSIDCKSGEASSRDGFAPEGYSLEIGSGGVTVAAASPPGVLRALATLRQLIAAQPPGASLPFVRIEDAPRFAWRGLMIDTARHFMSVAALKRQIDAMELVKLDVLHLHLSDNEAFRVESLKYPRLQAIASHGQYYTQAQIRDLVAYAADRGVLIVPEFDTPGHVGAILEAYPELRAAPPDPNDRFAAINGTLDPSSEATYRFLDGLFAEMARLFPGRYFHMGGDEVNAGAWAKAPQVQAFMKAHGLASQAQMEGYFHRRLARALEADGKIPIGWEEVAAAGAPADVVIQAWRTSNGVADSVLGGHPTIVSAGYYLDQLRTAAQSYAVDPYDLEADGFTPAEGAAAKAANPLAGAAVAPLVLRPLPPLTPAQAALVLGGEGELWSELVRDEMLDGRLWPRSAALAERFWSAADVRDPADMYRRLVVVQDELRRLGLEDLANRQRMAARLAPGDSGPVLAFLDLVEPVRNAAHNHAILALLRDRPLARPQALTELADAAPADSLTARRFEAEASRFAAGDRAGAEALKRRMQAWRDNDALFAAAAQGHPALEAALPVSADIASLAQAGLDAVAAIEAGRPMAADEAARAHAALTKAEAAEAASARPIFAFMRRQPPADLIIAITGGVRTLVDAAQGGPQ